ncbi:MAG: molybdopterin molybdotransferase MoeA [Micavibrio sp.]
MIDYESARRIIRETALAKKPVVEKIILADAAGRICAEELVAGLTIQPFDNSAMDGFAVHLADLEAASDLNPVTLRKAGTIGAGKYLEGETLEKGTCWHVMTGAVLPAGTEAIVPIENVTIDGDSVTFRNKPVAGEHIRYAGEDFKKGDPILSKEERITVAHILPLATLGIAEIAVFRKPKILFIPTGAEIVDELGAALQTGEIYNSNKFYAVSFLTACGADIKVQNTVRDDPDHFAKILAEADGEGYDIIISSGAVSAGSFDFVKEGLEKSGARILYHKIKLKPGRPNLFAEMPSGALYFGLPGNPVATAAGLRFLVMEALRIMQGQASGPPVYARAVNDFSKKPGLHMVLKGRLEYRKDGSVTVEILDGQESFKASPFLRMNCWIDVPEGQGTVKSGDIVETRPLLP